MPSFDFLDRVEQYVRTGTFPPEVDNKAARHVVKRASKQFIYKDKRLWKTFKGRLLKVVRSEEEMIEILTRYHEDNDHAGLQKMVKQILSLYFWSSVTEAVKGWLMKCPQCRVRTQLHKTVGPHRQQCLAYCCDSNSWNNPESVTFYRFPKDPEVRDKWLSVAQRDKGSLRHLSCLCAKHFDASCFLVDTEGQVTLKPDAVPTIVAATLQEDELPIAAEEDSLQISSLEELIAASDAAETIETTETTERPEPRMDLPEHQYAFPPPEHNRTLQLGQQQGLRKTSEPCFVMYDNIERFLKHGILPQQTKSHTFILKRASRRFGVINGVLMYTKVDPPVKVLRSRDEVIAVMRHFHDNQGHRGQGMCQRAIIKQFYWATLTKDLATWISTCDTCLNRPKKRRFRCSVYNCTNYSGPIERGLGMTFHKFPVDNPTLLTRWLRNLGRPHWHPSLWSSVCSSHFTEDCFDRSEGEVRLHPDSVPSLFIYSDPVNQARIVPTQPAPLEAVTTQDQIFFAKYDAVERYLRRGHYPPGLNGVEKNTLRRFAKSFIIKDEELHIVRGNRVRRVLRNREEVEMALVSYHDELNHLDLAKCIRLLNERCFWKTMRPDVVRWIDNCSQCSAKKSKKTHVLTLEPKQDPNQSLGSPQIPADSLANSDYDDDDDDDDEEDDEDDDDNDEEDEDSYEEDDVEVEEEEEEEEEEEVRKYQSKSRRKQTAQTSADIPAPCPSQPEITSTQETPPSMQPQPTSSTPSQSEDATVITAPSQTEAPDIQLATIDCSDETEVPPSPSSSQSPPPPSSLIWVVRRVSTQPGSPSQAQIQTEEHEAESQSDAEPQSPVHFEIISQTPITTEADPTQEQTSESEAQAQDQSEAPDQQPLEFHFITHPQADYETDPQPQPEVQTEVSVTETQDQSPAQIQPQPGLQTKTAARAPPQATPKRGSQTLPQKKRNSAAKPKASNQKTKLQTSKAKQTATQVSRGAQAKKRKGPEPKLPAKRNKSGPVSEKQKSWTVSKTVWTETIKRLKTEENRDQPVDPDPVRPDKILQARAMVQHCSQARVKVKPAVDGAEAQWAEIQEGMVVYVCFFQGATEDIVKEMANTLMKAKLFRNTLKRPSSVLELPGSVLLIPQDSLVGEQQLFKRKRLEYNKACAMWWSAQLYAKLVSACKNIMEKHATTSALGITVQHGTYGQKQEIMLASLEPHTHLLEF